ncbi:MAG TPA: extracellular solute-binding protein, partial [Mycobacteriales bacterium]
MIRALRRRGPVALGAGLAAILVAATGCGGDDGSAAASGGGGGDKIALTVNVFGNFGYKELYQQFQASHPNITITERGTGSDLSNYTPALTKNLAAGSGAGDVVALEEGIMIQFKQQAQRFVDLGQYGGNDDKGNFLPWKFEGGQSADGTKLIGLGTDVGSMGMCYRRDLFQKAGLPTDRDAVAKLWPSWSDYVSVGNQFKGKNTGAK